MLSRPKTVLWQQLYLPLRQEPVEDKPLGLAVPSIAFSCDQVLQRRRRRHLTCRSLMASLQWLIRCVSMAAALVVMSVAAAIRLCFFDSAVNVMKMLGWRCKCASE